MTGSCKEEITIIDFWRFDGNKRRKNSWGGWKQKEMNVLSMTVSIESCH